MADEEKPTIGQDRVLEGLLGLGGKGVELFGRAAEGIFSSPWTGVPAAILILSQIDPSGKLTIAFLTNVQTFISALADAVGQVAAKAIAAFFEHVPGATLPPEDAEGLFCVREISIAGIESHKCWKLSTDRDIALVRLREGDFFHLFKSIEPYDVKAGPPGSPGTQSYCVKYDGYLNVKGDQCFETETDRAEFVRIGLGTRRIANPFLYQKQAAVPPVNQPGAPGPGFLGPFASSGEALAAAQAVSTKQGPPFVQELPAGSGKWWSLPV